MLYFHLLFLSSDIAHFVLILDSICLNHYHQKINGLIMKATRKILEESIKERTYSEIMTLQA